MGGKYTNSWFCYILFMFPKLQSLRYACQKDSAFFSSTTQAPLESGRISIFLNYYIRLSVQRF